MKLSSHHDWLHLTREMAGNYAGREEQERALEGAAVSLRSATWEAAAEIVIM